MVILRNTNTYRTGGEYQMRKLTAKFHEILFVIAKDKENKTKKYGHRTQLHLFPPVLFLLTADGRTV